MSFMQINQKMSSDYNNANQLNVHKIVKQTNCSNEIRHLNKVTRKRSMKGFYQQLILHCNSDILQSSTRLPN